MKCQQCESQRVVRVTAKCNDMFSSVLSGHDYFGYVPRDMGIGGGDYVKFSYCADCGQIQGEFPVKLEEIYE